jgi:hypothetical protein
VSELPQSGELWVHQLQGIVRIVRRLKNGTYICQKMRTYKRIGQITLSRSLMRPLVEVES